jgi:hypothetical protein
MKKLLLAFITLIFIIIPVCMLSAEDDDYIDGDTVTKHETGDMLDGGVVDKVEKPTAVPTAVPEPTEAPKPVATEKPVPKPTLKPTPKPEPKKIVVKKASRPAPTAVPTAIPQPAKRAAEFSIVQAMAEEVAKKRNFNNYFGMMDRDRKFRLVFTLQNTGEEPSLNTGASLITSNTGIIISGAVKDLQTVLAGDKREITYEIVILGSYDGDTKLPLSLKIKSAGFEREYPLDIYVEPENPYILYAVAGGILLFLIILVIILTRRGSTKGSKKDDDFEMK